MLKIFSKTLSVLLAGSLSVQAWGLEVVNPKADWHVFETAHFRIHYTPEYREWTLMAAEEMEQSRRVLEQQQQRVLQPKVDVVVFDPLNDSNGFALPFSTKPFMALFTTSPLSDSAINNSTSWQQLLALHEYAHLLHLAQPERSAWRQQLRRIYDVFDISTFGVDRWVAEGYATLLESKLTGRGRLYDVQVEAMMQQFAREGAWPKYSELNNTTGKYKLGAMAYLVGGRFMHWLEQTYSEQTLDAVWTRIRGMENRSFDKAFKGVFHHEPEYLYQRFVAEYTHKVMTSERTNSKETLWLDGEHEMTSPSLNRDGSKLLVVEKSDREDGKVFLKVYETAENQKAKDEFAKRNKEILQADPLDIVDAEPLVFNKKRLHQLNQINGKGIRHPRWRSDDEILFIASTTDSLGALHQDLFSWKLSSDTVTQLSQGLNLRRFDIAGDQETVIAERNRFGQSSLVRLNLANSLKESALEPLIEGGMSTSFDFPRFNPTDTGQLAYLARQANQPWRLFLRQLGNGTEITIPMPEQYQFLSYLQWANDGQSLYFVAGQTDTLHVYEYELTSGSLRQVTEGQTPVAWPMELTQDGKTNLLYSSFRSTGPNLYLGPLTDDEKPVVATQTDPVDWSYLEQNSDYEIKMPAALGRSIELKGKDLDYNSSQGLGRQEVTLAVSGTATSASSNLLEVGVKGGDLMRRLNWLATASHDLTSDSATGVSAYVSWQGWPVDIAGNFYYFELDPSKQATSVNSVYGDFAGFNLSLGWDYGFYRGFLETYRGKLEATISHNERQQLNYAVEEHNVGILSHSQSWHYNNQDWGIYQSSDVKWLQGENDVAFLPEKDSWRGHQGEFELGVEWQGFRLTNHQRWLVREDQEYSFVRMGGMESNLMAARNLPNWVFIPELPFGVLTGDEFYQQTFSISKKGGLELYYSDLELDDRVNYEIVGIKDDFEISFLRAGLTDWHFSYGLADVIDSRDEHTIQGWLSVRFEY